MGALDAAATPTVSGGGATRPTSASAIGVDDGSIAAAADPILSHLAKLERAAGELQAELGSLRAGLRATRRLREDGLAVSEALERSPGAACLETVTERTELLAEVVREHRSLIVRHLVDEEGWSLSDIAARTGNARQVISRLYHARESALPGTRPRPKLRLMR